MVWNTKVSSGSRDDAPAGPEDGVGNLGAKARLASHKSDSGLGLRFVFPSHQILATPLIIICSSISIFFGRILCDALKELTEMETLTTRVVCEDP